MTIQAAMNESEAWEMLLRSLQFFLTKHTKKTLIVILLLAGSMLYVVMDYLSTDRVSIEKAVPMGEQFTLTPRAWAGGEPIKIGGKLYGFAESGFELEAWKLAGEPVLLVHDKKSGVIIRVETSAFSREQFKQYK